MFAFKGKSPISSRDFGLEREGRIDIGRILKPCLVSVGPKFGIVSLTTSFCFKLDNSSANAKIIICHAGVAQW